MASGQNSSFASIALNATLTAPLCRCLHPTSICTRGPMQILGVGFINEMNMVSSSGSTRTCPVCGEREVYWKPGTRYVDKLKKTKPCVKPCPELMLS